MTDKTLQPKVLEDYKHVVKVLKLKVIKQKEQIEALEEELRHYQLLERQKGTNVQSSSKVSQPIIEKIHVEQPRSKDLDYNILKNKVTLMQQFEKGCQKVGMDLDGLFRYTDVDYNNAVDSDIFRDLLSKLNLSLSSKQISTLVYMFDEQCTGSITKQQYQNALDAYQISSTGRSKAYLQDSLNQLALMFNKYRVDAGAFFSQITRGKQHIDLTTFQAAIKQKFQEELEQKQIIASFNQIDFEGQGKIEKNSFIYALKTSILKAKGQSLGKSQNLGKSQINVPNKSVLSPLKPSNLTDKQKSQTNSVIGRTAPKPIKDIQGLQTKQISKVEVQTSVRELVDQLQEHGVRLPDFIRSILQDSFERPLTVTKFIRYVKGEKSEIPQSLVAHLFRNIDKDQKGSVSLSELMEFVLTNTEDMDVIFRVIARSLEVQGLSMSKLFYLNELEDDSDISQGEFKYILSGRFQIPEGLLNKVWEYFDRIGKKTTKVAYIVKELSTYQAS